MRSIQADLIARFEASKGWRFQSLLEIPSMRPDHRLV